ncbi:MAG: hypothetical protein SVR08_04820 [Spirochaetota bacterium]|nr:hypothetical protein [Spirochaetota bacterium]
MIHEKDEYLHEYKRNKDWKESIDINFVDKKNNTFGSVEINYYYTKQKTEFICLLIVNDKIYKHKTETNIVQYKGKKIANKTFEYKINKPMENFDLKFSNESLQAKLKIFGLCPVHLFPTNIGDNSDQSVILQDITLWNQYEQRCRITGDITIKNGEDKGLTKKIECFGQREHSWGRRLTDRMNCQSRLSIQFRDMAMIVNYFEIDGHTISSGVITRKRGNIPIQCSNLESISISKDNMNPISTEFSYKDAQNDVDLIVSKTLHTIPIQLSKNMRNTHKKFKNFSEFTIIGINKKGIGMEYLYTPIEKLENME